MECTEKRITSLLERSGSYSIVELVEAIIEDASALRASDIHIGPRENSLVIRLRIDGVLSDFCSLPKTIHNEVISRIKVLSWLRTDEHQAAQDGRFRVTLQDGSPVDIRVSVAPTYHGENVVMRLLSDTHTDYTLSALGFTEDNRKKILHALERPYGMILATGPTGSGKTTTLYTLIKLQNTDERSIITIEDPIEYSIEGITQIQSNLRTGLTFASGLRSILRQDPNIIMVGEIRDSDTAAIAVNAALTGHLLLSSLHTNDAATTLPRLLDMGVDSYLIASTVHVAIGQRLVRRICKECKEEVVLSDDELKSVEKSLTSVHTDRELPSQNFYKGKGCTHCGHTGYQGRIGIHEVLVVDPDIQNAIVRKESSATIRKLAIQNGMIPMSNDGYTKALEGHTTITEVLRTVQS